MNTKIDFLCSPGAMNVVARGLDDRFRLRPYNRMKQIETPAEVDVSAQNGGRLNLAGKGKSEQNFSTSRP